MAGHETVLDQVLSTAAGLKAGSWESVEALAVLALAARERPDEAASLVRRASDAAARVKPGGWESVRALAWLSIAARAQPPG